MDALDLVPQAGVEASQRVHEHFVTASSSNQTYSQITASGSSRVHNGNNYYITYECSTGRQPMPVLCGDHQVMVEQVSRSSQKRKRPVSDTSEMMRDNQERQTLATVLESLGQYSKSMQQEIDGEQGRMIAAQLTLILGCFQDTASGEERKEEFDRRVQDLKNQLRCAKRTKINARSPQSHSSRPYKIDSKFTIITSGRWTTSLTTRTTHSRLFDGHSLTETYTALRVQGGLDFRGPYIAASFGERIDTNHTIIMHPIVVAYNQIDNGAKVFELVANDDLDGLTRHLASGQASMRDCDTEGRSLLHYACYNRSVETCKFLAENGCDVDWASAPIIGVSWLETPLAAFHRIETPATKDASERSLMCQRHLLQAGADPTACLFTIDDDTQPRSAIKEALTGRTGGCFLTDPLKQMICEGSAFFDVRTFRENGRSLWMWACSTAGMLNSPDILRILVQAGADTTEADDEGWNCLFNCVIKSSRPSTSAEFEALRFLLTVYDNIFERDNQDCDIFEFVAGYQWCDWSHYGSYRNDLWYCALYRSGLSLRYDIPPPPPRPLFDSSYTIEHYRALLYLDIWNFEDRHEFSADSSLTKADKHSQQEKETTPGFREWKTSDLQMMEKRMSEAVHVPDGYDDIHDFDVLEHIMKLESPHESISIDQC